jgi:hypothetical protein
MTTSRDKSRATEEDRGSGRGRTITTENVAAVGKVEPEFAEAETVESSEMRESDFNPLFSDETQREFRTRWQEVQTGFVDEPRQAVEHADELVAQLMQQLAQSFSDQRSGLERQWEQAKEVSTEDLRLALRRYRSFFERLLSI